MRAGLDQVSDASHSGPFYLYESQGRVYQAPLGLQNPDPEDGAGDDGHDRRHIEKRTVDGDAARLLIQQEGQECGDYDVEGHED